MTTQSQSIRTAADIRRDFIDYFAEKHGHTVAPSSPVVPHEDPTLLFTNAGMNQFKDVFLGQGTRDFNRAVNTQKCIRAGGKHNDLEDVGKDNYHHTFFEMLGNWSFGDYFKEEAIGWAWELLTEVWGLAPDRLFVTVFAGDEHDGLEPDLEAEDIWKKYVDPSHISRWDKKDNFWEMGETGPCGPCSEIHYDFTPDASGAPLVNAGDPRVIELWNLVFIQFNRAQGGRLTPLPSKHVDTGMGLERLVRVLQHRDSNYDTDLFTPIFRAIEAHTGAHPYQGALEDPLDVAYRVIADHIRCLAVAITDGAHPGAEGRNYVLRRILRRAVRHAHQTLNTTGAWLHELVPTVVETLGDAFPELKKNPKKIAQIIGDEEESFLKTLDRGIELFENAAARASDSGQTTIDAHDAFKLHDTYGFPIDLTRVMAQERGMTVDEAGYERLMERARETSRRTGGTSDTIALTPEAISKLKHLGVEPTRDIDKYHSRPLSATIKAIWNGTDFDNVAHNGSRVAVILDRTSHYAEQGGQIGDRGTIFSDAKAGTIPVDAQMGSRPKGGGRFDVEDTQASGGFVLHLGRVTDRSLRVGDAVMVDVENRFRDAVRANHTGTHLMNFALREALGDDVHQKGSLVADDRLRFDLSHSRAMSMDEISEVERIVSAMIDEAMNVHADLAPLEQAMQINGVRAVFGERYPDPVRVVSIGVEVSRLIEDPTNAQWRSHSVEFCGGTHLVGTDATTQLIITQETALAAGVRRIIALTGTAAQAADVAGRDLQRRADELAGVSDDDVVGEFNEVRRLVDELTIGTVARHRVHETLASANERIKSLQKGARDTARNSVVDQARQIAEAATGHVIVDQLLGADKETLLSAMDVIRAKHPDAAAMLFSGDEIESKVVIIAGVPKELIGQGLKAGDWIRQCATICGGGGGGRPDLAQAGGKDPSKIAEAIDCARAYAREALR